MFSEFTPVRGSIWKAQVNSLVGIVFVGTCALWAGLVIIHATWGTNPVASAFAATIHKETTLR